MWTNFINIFTGDYSWITIILMVVGLVLCIVEACIPGFGVFGIVGLVCEVGAIVLHAIFNPNNPIEVLILFLLITLMMLFVFLLFVRSARFGFLNKTSIIQNKSALPMDYNKTKTELLNLVGKDALTITECKPVGKIRINQDIYEAHSKGSMIAKGEVVKVVSVVDTTVYIDKIIY